ncbi:MAG: aldolase [Candidatus Dependentiae bacterium]|nr:aldolase [Candidatus Dependentiae bacterium]
MDQKTTSTSITIPADVPRNMRATYIKNYNTITQNSGRLFLFACDQKIEHMNDDFIPPLAHPDAADPEHLFRIAHAGRIGAMATHLGLIARYGNKYTTIPYIIKLTAKTNLMSTTAHDPLSELLNDMHEVMIFKHESGLNIAGVGLTLYPGSDQEHSMLKQAANTIFAAHQQGLIAILWMYPRGQTITNETDPHLIAGAVGIADALGADFVKIKPPHDNHNRTTGEYLKHVIPAAGNTRVICSGGPKATPSDFLQELHNQLHSGGTSGCATGRNIFQHSLAEAIALTQAISSLVFDDANVEQALVFMQKLS